MLRHLVDKQRDVLKALGLALVKLNPVSKSENPSTSIVKMSNNTAQDNAVLIMSSLYQSGPVNMTDTIKMIAQGIAGGSRDFIIDADDGLGHFLSELESMKDNASYTHKMVRITRSSRLASANNMEETHAGLYIIIQTYGN